MIRLTYGFLPDYDIFRSIFETQCPQGVYRVRNCHVLGNIDLSCRELYEWLDSQARMLWQDGELRTDKLDIASSILQTLDIEWI